MTSVIPPLLDDYTNRNSCNLYPIYSDIYLVRHFGIMQDASKSERIQCQHELRSG